MNQKPTIEVVLHWIDDQKAWTYHVYDQSSKSLAAFTIGRCFDIDSVAREIRFGTTSPRYTDFDLDRSTYRYAGTEESYRLPFWSVAESDPQDFDPVAATPEDKIEHPDPICIGATTRLNEPLGSVDRSRHDWGTTLHRESIRRICGVCPIQMFDMTDPLGQRHACPKRRCWSTTCLVDPVADSQKLFRIVDVVIVNGSGLAYDEVKYLHLVGGELKEVTETEAYLIAKELK